LHTVCSKPIKVCTLFWEDKKLDVYYLTYKKYYTYYIDFYIGAVALLSFSVVENGHRYNI